MSYSDEVRSVGRGFGCAAMVVLTMIPLALLLIVLTLSGAHCEPVPQCQQSSEARFGLMFGGVVVVAILVGAAIWRLIDTLAARREDRGGSTGYRLLATAITAGVTGLTLYAEYALSG